MRFADRVVLITGGGSGIGAATARSFAAAGAEVLITGRRQEALETVAAGQTRIHPYVADMTDLPAIPAAVDHVRARFGRLDVLVNNAAIMGSTALTDLTAEQIHGVLATNLVGPTLLAQAAVPLLRTSGGTIINVSTVFARRPAPPAASYYGASKAALEALTRSWAIELGPLGIRVNAVAPGPTETPALDHAGLQPEVADAIRAREAARSPLGRRGRPEEIATWILHLAAADATWTTGAVLDVDGGFALPTYDPA